MSNEREPGQEKYIESNTKIEVLTEVREDAKTTLEKQVQQMENLNTKAIEIVKITPVIAGIFLTGLSFAAEAIIQQSGQQSAQQTGITELATDLNVFIFIGLFLLFVSPVFAFAAYSPQRVIIGPGKDNIREIIYQVEKERWDPEYRDYTVYYNIAQTKAYAGFIRDNQATQFRKSGLFLVSVLLLTFGTGALILGYLLLFGFGVFDFIIVVVVLSIVVIAIFAWTGARVLEGMVDMLFRRWVK